MQRCYILVNNYEQGLALHDLLDQERIENRIAPTPASARERVGCGMCVMVVPEVLGQVKACITAHRAEIVDIVTLDNQLNGRRDRYC